MSSVCNGHVLGLVFRDLDLVFRDLDLVFRDLDITRLIVFLFMSQLLPTHSEKTISYTKCLL
jgi:hypothetical protein